MVSDMVKDHSDSERKPADVELEENVLWNNRTKLSRQLNKKLEPTWNTELHYLLGSGGKGENS